MQHEKEKQQTPQPPTPKTKHASNTQAAYKDIGFDACYFNPWWMFVMGWQC